MITLLIYFAFIQLSLLVPGYVFIKQTQWLKGKPGLELSAAYAVSLAGMALFATLGYVANIPHVLIQILHWGILLLSVFLFIRKQFYKNIAKQYVPLLAMLAMSIFSTAFTALSYTGALTFIPDPEAIAGRNYDTLNVKVLNVAQTNANDNFIPYRQAQFIVNESDPAKDSFISEWGVHFFQRTPLMGAVTAEYFILLGDKPPIDYPWSETANDTNLTYAKFQIISHIVNALLVIPGFYLIAHFFKRRTAILSLLFMIPSHFFLFSTFFSWPKSLTAFFILLSWLLLFEQKTRYIVLAAAASGIAYLTHDLAVLYIGASILLLMYYKRFRHMFILSIGSALFALPWFIVSGLLYKKPSTFIYYPFSVYGIPQIEQKEQVMRDFFATSPLRLIAIRLESLFYLLSPYQLLVTEGVQEWGRRLWACSLFNVPGAIGMGLVIPAIIGAFKRIRDLSFWILMLVPIILCTIIIGWPNGLGALHFAQASVLLAVGLACWFLLRFKNPIWFTLAYLANVAQLIFFIVYSYGPSYTTWLTRPRDILLLGILATIVVACGVAGWLVTTDKQQKIGEIFATLRRKLSNGTSVVK